MVVLMGTKVKQALISVWDKRELAGFASGLQELGIKIISTGGTSKFLKEHNISVQDVTEVTGYAELFEGRVKTLHPKIHGAILFRRDKEEDVKQAQENRIEPIDLVVVNLYPFEQVAGKEGTEFHQAIEMIDIGGPALLRAAAKNYQHVTVVTDPGDYQEVLGYLKNEGEVPLEKRRHFAVKAFARTSSYDVSICRYLSSLQTQDLFPEFLEMQFVKAYPLRYGENPSQQAAAYRIIGKSSICDSRIYAGSKPMSYNNFLDADTAFGLIREFKDEIATVILKHNNPCGGAQAETLVESYHRAYAGDPLSAFGGVIAFSRKVDVETAKAIGNRFIEVVLAPGYEEGAIEILRQKESRRIMDVSNIWDASMERAVNFRYVTGGMLIQGRDPGIYDKNAIKIVTDRKPTQRELDDAYFATKFCKHTKSNAISIAKDLQLIGNGAGQMSRVDAAMIAIEKAKRYGFDLNGATAASDAFFPFPDGIDVLAKAGITCIVQPGGSIRDQEVIDVANQYGISMIFTGRRHFKH
ncbi:MAG: bifunctional phosphoribosylaminoimidazolecarboxamide formyltransferase/IMP cyclohydrolase [Candidatus Micrarchaeota archaeon]|nr:bifunctional phosphoribosylaminoimidazolecarboxamide formyltransferase/IMP cyclohydrolase [Candidatus Micrarchaeota archaeon]